MYHALLTLTLILAAVHPRFAPAAGICGNTLSMAKAGACDFGGGDWNSAFEGAKQAMLKVLHNSQARSDIANARLNFDSSSSGAAFYVTGNTVNLRTGVVGGASPSSYGITLIHELCHVAGHSARKDGGGDIQGSFGSTNSCHGVSPYAGCGGNNEMFAESCTAYLVAPEKLSGCSNPGGAQNYMQANLFNSAISECGAGDKKQNNNDDLMKALASALPLAMMAMQPKPKAEAPPSMEQFCAKNPTNPACAKLDCNNPENASSANCLCDPKNPASRNSPVCANQKGGLNSSADDLESNSRGGGLAGADLGGLMGDQAFTGTDFSSSDPSVDANQKGGGGGGPSAGSSGGGLANSGLGLEGSDPGPYETDILKGTEKGGGGGTALGKVAEEKEIKQEADLKEYLPEKTPDRNIAGMSLYATDGLTGPLGPSIWEKVSARYQKVKYFLKP